MSHTATISFDLRDPEAKEQFRMACSAAAMYSALWDMDQYLREQVKYHEPDQRDDTYEIRERLHTIMSEHGITLDI